MITIAYEFDPISVNTCWQGKRFKTPEYKTWREEFYYTTYQPGDKPIQKMVGVHISLNNKSRMDIDNVVKPILDGLQESKVIRNDNQVKELRVDKNYNGKGFLVSVYELL